MLKIGTILKDFASWSTVGCVNKVAFSPFKWLRWLWFLIFIAMVAVFIAQLVMIILKYLSYPADTSTTMVFSSQPFPDVTICNYNPFKLSVVTNNSDFEEINRMLIEYKASESGVTGSNEFGFQGLDRFERLDRATDLLVFLAANLTEAQKEPALYKIEELITECLFAGLTCDPGAVEAVPDPLYGRCFVFRGGRHTITRPGLAFGLRFILTANLADSFTFVSDYLPTTSRVGVRMTVNDQESLVSLDNQGFNIGVGYQTSIALSKSRTERIKEPYGHCVDEMDTEHNHYSDLPYTMESCFITCQQKKIVERCGCAHPSMRKADNETWCTTAEDATCVATHRGDQLNETDANVNQYEDCGCKSPCKESEFGITISVLTYPAFGYTVGVGTTNQSRNQQQEQNKKTTTTTSTTTTLTSTTSTSTTTSPTSTTTSTTTTTTTPSPTTTTKASTTTTPNCPNSFRNNPAYLEAYNRIIASGKIKVIPNPGDACRPRFECKTGYAKEWWKCWPCYYECSGGSAGQFLPIADWPVPDVKCSLLFEFAAVEVGYGDPARTFDSAPNFGGWAGGSTNLKKPECDAEKAKQVPKTTTSTTTSTTSTTSTTTTTTTEAPINWVTSCSSIQSLIWNGGGYYADGIAIGNNKPTLKSLKSKTNWFEHWPCTYKCSDGTRFPTNPTIANVKCVDLFKCFEIDPDKFTNEPNFQDWEKGGTGSDDCAAMQNVGPTSGRKKRSVLLPSSPSSSSTTTTKPIDNLMGMPGKGSCESWNTNFKNVSDCKTWYKMNGMIVNVYYESLEYQVLTENAAYSIPQAVNDLGGQAGLWLGLSMVSIVECIGLVFVLLLFCVTGKNFIMRQEEERKAELMDELPPARK